MKIPQHPHFPAFSMIVDVNSFTALVAQNELGAGVAQFVRDILVGPIAVVEREGGSVIGVNGDAIFAILPDAESTFLACAGIAKDLNNMCSYLADSDYITSIPAPPSLKIGVEYGILDNSTITTKALGKIRSASDQPPTTLRGLLPLEQVTDVTSDQPHTTPAWMRGYRGKQFSKSPASEANQPIHTTSSTSATYGSKVNVTTANITGNPFIQTASGHEPVRHFAFRAD